MQRVLLSANDPVFGREALNKRKEDAKPLKVKEPLNKGRELPSKAKMPPTKPENPWKYKESSFGTNPSGTLKPPVSDGAGPTNNRGSPSCQLCSRAHDLHDCELFNKKTPELKRAFLREKNMCFGCYGTNHLSRNCSNKRKCKHCGRLHPSALHIDGFQLPQKDNTSPAKQKNDKAVNNACTNPQNASCHAAKPNESRLIGVASQQSLEPWCPSRYIFFPMLVLLDMALLLICDCAITAIAFTVLSLWAKHDLLPSSLSRCHI